MIVKFFTSESLSKKEPVVVLELPMPPCIYDNLIVNNLLFKVTCVYLVVTDGVTAGICIVRAGEVIFDPSLFKV